MKHPDRLTCEDVFRKFDDYVDRELSADEIRRVREHIEVCAFCAAEYRFEESVLRNVREKIQRIEAPSDLKAKIARLLGDANSNG